MIKLKGLLNEGPQKVGNINAFGASKVLGKGKKVLGFVPDTPNAVATLIQDFPQAMEIEFKQGFVYKGENHKSIKKGSTVWKELEKRFLDTATKDVMKAGFKMNEEVNENEVSYKVAGRPVTLIKGKKSNGLDWKVKFQNGKETLLANVITLINPFPPVTAKGGVNEAKVKTPTEIVTSVPASSIPDQYLAKADVGLGLSMFDGLGRGWTLNNKDYSLDYSNGKVVLKLTSSGKTAVRVKSEHDPKYVQKIEKFASDYLSKYAKDILTEATDLKKYPADVQKQYNDLLKNFGQAFADRYLERYDEENEPSEPGLKQQIYDKLKLAKQNTAKEMKQKKFGSDKYPTILLKHFGIELRKLGKITDAQLNQLINKEGIKTIWQETEFIFKILSKQKK